MARYLRLLRSIPIMYLVSLCIMGISFSLTWTHLPPQIPLFYSAARGDQQIVPFYYILILPVISLLAIILNSFFTNTYMKDIFSMNIAYYLNTFVIVFITFIFVKILLLVT